MEREYDDYFNGTQRTIHLMDKELQKKKRYATFVNSQNLLEVEVYLFA